MLSKDSLFSLQLYIASFYILNYCIQIFFHTLNNIKCIYDKSHSSKEWTVRSHSKIIILENFWNNV